MRDAIDLYYGMLGWDADTGAPTRAKLYELGLDHLVDTTASADVSWQPPEARSQGRA